MSQKSPDAHLKKIEQMTQRFMKMDMKDIRKLPEYKSIPTYYSKSTMTKAELCLFMARYKVVSDMKT